MPGSEQAPQSPDGQQPAAWRPNMDKVYGAGWTAQHLDVPIGEAIEQAREVDPNFAQGPGPHNTYEMREIAAEAKQAGSATDYDRFFDSSDPMDDKTVAGAAVATERQTSAQSPDLAKAEESNRNNAADNLGLTREQYKNARIAGQLSATSGNPGEVSRISDDLREEISNPE